MTASSRYRAWIGLLVLFLSVGLAGCASEEERNPQVSMQVDKVEAVDIDCSQLGTDSDCHRLTVSISNENQQEPFDVNTFYWKAISQSGEVFETPDEEGPDKIQPGSESQVVLSFETPTDVQLKTLQYETPLQDQPINASVPSYEAQHWQPPVSVQVDGISATNVDCDRRSNDTYCHSIDVKVTNEHSEENADTSGANWKATTLSGSIVEFPDVEGSQSLTPRATTKATVNFDLEPETRLDSLIYQPSFSPRGLNVSLPDYQIEEYSSGINLTVTGVDSQPNDCPDYSDDSSKDCHSIDVVVANNHEEESADMNQFNWKATATDGGDYDVYEVQGPDSVPSGSESSVTVQVELPSGEEVKRLQFEDSWMPKPATVQVG
jgi:hypothetical protein